ncbi:MAG: SHOCT domain-containing protein [Syntrophaceae bacterium]|nr:SHOCT domain-containing protein [Syntrophaceae bacterium]
MKVKGQVRPSKPASALGLIFGIIFVVIGVSVAIPNFGPFGVVWTLAALGISVFFAANTFSEHGVAEEVIEFDTLTQPEPEGTSAASTEERLKKLEGLKQKGLLSDDEYQLQRKKIINEL